jgi:hypothetical protein
MAGPKPLKKPKPKPIKHSNGMYSFIDCEDTFAVNVEIFQWSEESEQFIKEDVGTHTLEGGVTFEVDEDGKVSNIN